MTLFRSLLASCLLFVFCSPSFAQLEAALLQRPASELAAASMNKGDATQGAILFYQRYMACTQCHNEDANAVRLGPRLSEMGSDVSDAAIVESVLQPSMQIREAFRTHNIATTDGKTLTGLIRSEDDNSIELADISNPANSQRIAKSQIEEREVSLVSAMPAGMVNQLRSEQQFYDLIKYLLEIRSGGPQRALQLKPAAALYAVPEPAAYESDIDHAGMIADLDDACFRRGEEIYQRLCINCHGTVDQAGSLPTSLRFASGKFKNGSDPYSMYQTLTRGFGMMVPQTWMVPQQKYDVIHYIRQAYLRPHNPSQLTQISADYLASLPQGNSRGPEPSNITAWTQMDYGPSLINTYEVGDDGSNFAHKGIAVRVDEGPGGVSQGRYWMVFDHDTMRMAAAWSGEGFIDWRGIHFDGRHGIHPRLVGTVAFENKTGPGWARPGTTDFADDRVVGRDNRMYGPLPREWAQYQGLYNYGPKTVIEYTVGDTPVLESPDMTMHDGEAYLVRHMEVGKRSESLTLSVAMLPNSQVRQTLELPRNDDLAAIRAFVLGLR
ncbi:MAG: DUF6797 domain-containing protein [Pirellulaceae bacterium]